MKNSDLPKITEKEFQEQVIKLAKLCGWRVAHFRPVRVQRKNGETYYETPVQADGAGFPDLLLCRGHRCIVAELKVPPNKPTQEQAAWITAFRLAGIDAVVWTPDDFEEIQETLR